MIKYLPEPIYYWSSYWLEWDSILGFNTKTDMLVCENVNNDFGKQGIREHCTTLNKSCLAIKLTPRNEYKKYDEFRSEVKKTSNEAYKILINFGIPKYFIDTRK